MVTLLAACALPVPVAAQEQTLTGWFHTVAIHRPGDADVIEYWLTDDQGARVVLLIDGGLLAAHGGVRGLDRQRVTVRGHRVPASGGSAPAVAVLAIELATPPSPEAGVSAVAASAASVSRPWVTLLCRFGDATNVTPHNVAWFEGLMTGNAYPGMAHYWSEASYGAVNLNGSVVIPWHNLPLPRSAYVSGGGFDLDRLAKDCTAAAAADVHFPAFFGINLMFNGDLPVSVGGTWVLALDGPARYYAVTWIPNWGYGDHGLVAHEMGHGFGFPHSSGPYGKTYDSRWDVMSNWADNCRTPHPTYGCVGTGTIAHHKNVVGWIPAARQFVAGAGTLQTITVDRLALPEGSASYLMAVIPIGGSTTRFYTVEARDLAGYDNQLPARAVIIHKVDTSLQDSDAQVVDVDRNRNPNDAVAMWLPDETFSDPANGISVSIVAPDGPGFQVTIASNPSGTAALTIVRAGGGGGMVTSTPAGIDCGIDCTEPYSPLTAVRLHAAPGPGAVFTGWSGGGCGGVSDCTVTLTSSLTVTATFQPAAAVAPDLVVTSVANPPLAAVRGGRFRVSDTVQNQGDGATPASRTRYYLSANAVRDGADVPMTGTRKVKPLPAGATSSGSITVTVPSAMPSGAYFLLACADDPDGTAERSETNNCAAAHTTVSVLAADLTATAVSAPPGEVTRGARFPVTDWVKNQGTAPARASRVRYYLSRDGVRDGGDTLLVGTRSVATLGPGETSTGTVTVTVPSSTAAGTYYLLACTDDLAVVSELVETNNCQSSGRKVVISP